MIIVETLFTNFKFSNGVLSHCDSHAKLIPKTYAQHKFAEDNTSTSLLLVSIPYLCLLSLPNLITAYLGSPFIPGDVDNVKMDEWPLR